MRRLFPLNASAIARHGLGLLAGCVLSIGLANMGCAPDTRRSGSDSGTRLPTDAGIRLDADDRPPPPPPRQDSGGIVLMDSGPPRVDSGPPPPPPGACRLDAFTQLPAACLPRCSSTTEAAILACEDGTCLNAALDADTTPSITLTLPDGSTTPLDCGLCWGQQIQSCWFELCRDQFLPWDECERAGGTCTVEADALQLCREGSSVVSCENSRLDACFF